MPGVENIEQMPMAIETVLWRRLDLPGHEIASLYTLDQGRKLSGSALFSSDEGPAKLDYAIVCDSAWRTDSAQITGAIRNRQGSLNVSVDARRKWRLNGVECGAVEECLDIDLGFSPSTNLLPIRRLALTVGEEAEVRAAWLPFPSLDFVLLPQVYRREGETIYRYESAGGAFVRSLQVNAFGFVTSYPELWVAEPTPS
jgi:uncharacterized protein